LDCIFPYKLKFMTATHGNTENEVMLLFEWTGRDKKAWQVYPVLLWQYHRNSKTFSPLFTAQFTQDRQGKSFLKSAVTTSLTNSLLEFLERSWVPEVLQVPFGDTSLSSRFATSKQSVTRDRYKPLALPSIWLSRCKDKVASTRRETDQQSLQSRMKGDQVGP
jgi:isochorismate synthase EntC